MIPVNSLQVGLADIASIAGVSLSAVSHWRKRYEDFPKANGDGSTGFLFDFEEIQAWLLENGKIEEPVSKTKLLWKVADSLRTWWSVTNLTDFIISVLLILEAHHRNTGNSSHLSSDSSWNEIMTANDDDLIPALIKAGKAVEKKYEALRGAVVDGLRQEGMPPANSIRQLLEVLAARNNEINSLLELFEELLVRRSRVDRFAGEHDSPTSLCEMISSMVPEDAVTFCDPAMGTGQLLAAVSKLPRGNKDNWHFVGNELDPRAFREAQARFFLADLSCELKLEDAFDNDWIDNVGADAVVLQGTLGMRKWGSAEVLMSQRWPYGSPPATNADFAWLQIALRALGPRGVAFVVLPRGSLSSGSRQHNIREAMLRSGAVEAIISLPGRLLMETSIPVVVWVLRKDPEANKPLRVLFVDAKDAGDNGRSQVTLAKNAIQNLSKVIKTWLQTHEIDMNNETKAFSCSLDELDDSNLWRPFAKSGRIERPTRQKLEMESSDLRRDLVASLGEIHSSIAELSSWLEGSQQ